MINLATQRTSNKNGGLVLFLQHTDFAANSISRSQNQPPHFPHLRILHGDVTLKAIHTQKTDDETLHLGLGKLTANAAPRALQERHECVGRVVSRKMVPSIGVKDISIVTPERRQAVYSVGVDVYRRAGGDIVATKTVIGNGLTYCHGDRRNVPQGFATYVVQVMEIVSVKFGKALDVVTGHGIEEEGVVLLDLCSNTRLNFGMRGE